MQTAVEKTKKRWSLKRLFKWKKQKSCDKEAEATESYETLATLEKDPAAMKDDNYWKDYLMKRITSSGSFEDDFSYVSGGSDKPRKIASSRMKDCPSYFSFAHSADSEEIDVHTPKFGGCSVETSADALESTSTLASNISPAPPRSLSESSLNLAEQQKRDSLTSLDSIASEINLEQKDLTPDDTRLKAALIHSLALLADARTQLPNFIRNADILEDSEHIKATSETWIDGKLKQSKIKIYHKDIFRSLWSPQEYIEMMIHFLREFTKTGAGKSGSSMYWSHDKKYIAKTLSPIEVSKGRNVIKKLCEYHSHQPRSLLVKYSALIRIRLGSAPPVYFTIMPNVLHGFSPEQLFDLKGSTYGRISEDGAAILKDVNFSEGGYRIHFPNHAEKQEFLDQLGRDTAFLHHQSRIDYSLLIGIGTAGTWKAGIIDILTPFSKRKVLEYSVMGTLHGYNEISCSPPSKYAARFYIFVSKACFSLS